MRRSAVLILYETLLFSFADPSGLTWLHRCLLADHNRAVTSLFPAGKASPAPLTTALTLHISLGKPARWFLTAAVREIGLAPLQIMSL